MEVQSDGKAITTKTLFSRTTSVAINITSTPKIIWSLLTDATKYPMWNSTVTSIEGVIDAGQTIKLKSTLDSKRTFTLKIKDFQPSTRLSWGDAMGARVYELTDLGDGNVYFLMSERIGGPLFPLFASQIPSFDRSFEQFAADLKHAAEKN